jgi:hypothetical protein
MINTDGLFVSVYDEVKIQCMTREQARSTLQRIQDALKLMNTIERAVNSEEGVHYDLLIKNCKSYDPDNI